MPFDKKKPMDTGMIKPNTKVYTGKVGSNDLETIFGMVNENEKKKNKFSNLF